MSAPQQRTKERIWLIKSSTYLTGPFSQEDIFAQIKSRQIVAIDEIVPAFGNWSYVRDIDIFRDELLKANAQAGRGEITKTASSGTQSTDQLTQTENLEATEEITSAGGGVDRTNPNPDLGPLNTRNLPKTPPQNFIKKPEPQPFGWTRFFLSVALFAALVFGGKWAYFEFINKKGPDIDADQSLMMAQADFAKGDYKNAYKHFQNIIKVGAANTPSNFYIQMAALVLNQERQTVYARDLLSQAPKQMQNTPEWLTTQGLSYLIDQNYSKAEGYFLKSIRQNPQFLAAWVNIGHLYLSQKKYQEAWDHFYASYIRGYREGHIPMYMALTLIDQWRISSDSNLLTKANELVENFMVTNADRRDYLSIMHIWLKNKISNVSLDSEIDNFIQYDPYGFNEIRLNAYEYVFDPKNLEPFCEEIFSKLPREQMQTLLYSSLCYQRIGFIGDIVEGPIKKASERYGTEPLVYGAQAVVLSQMGVQYQKSLLIGRAISTDSKSKYTLPLILQAHFCEDKGDFKCAYKYWKMVNDRDKLEIGAYSGMAKYFLSQRKINDARTWIADGLLIAPSYKPLIELQLKVL